MTPIDKHSYIGLPELWCTHYKEIHISVCFTWDMPLAFKLAKEWKQYGRVRFGGPAFNEHGRNFVPGRYLKKGVTITSRGCPKRCSWCLVPKREGDLRELPIRDGWIVQDNNLLACSVGHIQKIFEMLARQPKPASFPGGLDLDYLNTWHIELLKSIRTDQIWISFDTPQSIEQLNKARDLLSDFNIEKKRAYVLIGYEGDSLYDAEKRLETVYNAGFLPFAMRYRTKSCYWEDTYLHREREWNLLTRKWTRPANYRTKKDAECKHCSDNWIESRLTV